MKRVSTVVALLSLLIGCGTTDDVAGIAPGAALAAGGTTSSDGGVLAYPGLVAGFRASRPGIDPFPDAPYWADAASAYAAGLGATPGGVWIIGGVLRSTDCFLSFPSSASAPANVEFGDADENEAYLSHFDTTGAKVWLMVEPGDAEVEPLIDLVLERYGHHPSVIGFGVAVEWYRVNIREDGIPVTDAAAASWRDRLQSHDPSYTLALQHWLIDRMPPNERDGIVFTNDSQILSTMDALVDEFAVWGQAFSPATVAYEIGFDSDREWWSALNDPPGDLARAILERVPNAGGMFWVEATLRDVF